MDFFLRFAVASYGLVLGLLYAAQIWFLLSL